MKLIRKLFYRLYLLTLKTKRSIIDKHYYSYSHNYKYNIQHVKRTITLLNRNELLKKLPYIAKVAEIGVNEGEFSQHILSICKPTKLFLIDLWSSKRYNNNKFDSVNEKFRKYIEKGEVEIIRDNSLSAHHIFNNEYFDWIYIDTDHSYQQTIQELYAWEPKIKPNGFICGHDYVMGNWDIDFRYGVIEAVTEFCVKENWKVVYLTLDNTENNSFAIQKI